MKKFIRNLLMGVTTSFWPMEKASAEFSILDFPEFFPAPTAQAEPISTTVDTNKLNKILNDDFETVPCQASLDQVNDLLNLIDEAEANGWPSPESETNQIPQAVSTPLVEKEPSTNETVVAQVPATNEVCFTQTTNEVLSVSESTTSTNILDVADTASETNALPFAQEPVIPENTNTVEAVEHPLTQTVETVQTKSDTNRATQPDLAELLSALEEKKLVSTKPKTTSIKKKSWFSYIFSALMIGSLIGAVWLADKFDKRARKKRLQKRKEAESMTAHVVSEVKKAVPVAIRNIKQNVIIFFLRL